MGVFFKRGRGVFLVQLCMMSLDELQWFLHGTARWKLLAGEFSPYLLERSMQEQDAWNRSIVLELRRLAERAMAGERAGHSLQPTALINEAWLILKRQRNLDLNDRPAFLAAAACTVRRILVDHARRRNAEKRGGQMVRQNPLHITLADYANDVDFVGIHEALDELSRHSERAARIVELRFFGGMTGEEIASEIGISLRTVNNDWKFAKAWLYRQLNNESAEE